MLDWQISHEHEDLHSSCYCLRVLANADVGNLQAALDVRLSLLDEGLLLYAPPIVLAVGILKRHIHTSLTPCAACIASSKNKHGTT